MSSASYFRPDWLAPDNVMALVTTRSGGVSAAPYASFNLAQHVGDVAQAVDANRHLLAAALQTPLQWQWLQQVHGTDVVRVNRAGDELIADGLITATPGIACCVLTADCLSVFFTASDGSEVAVAHAGWRGMVAGILANTVRGMSVAPENLLVWLGPAIGPCHFEVGEDVREAFLAVSSHNADCFQPTSRQGKYMADLFGLARRQLRDLGVQHIAGGGECTCCESDKYFSYRSEGTTGRQLSLIYLQGA